MIVTSDGSNPKEILKGVGHSDMNRDAIYIYNPLRKVAELYDGKAKCSYPDWW